jgi:glutaconate CoA-transferase subunit B
VVITDLGEYHFDEETGEMTLTSLHPGVTMDDIVENTGWEMSVADDVKETLPPTDEELRLIREELDPEGTHSR